MLFHIFGAEKVAALAKEQAESSLSSGRLGISCRGSVRAASAPSSLIISLKKPEDLKFNSLCRHQSLQKKEQKPENRSFSSKTALTAIVGLVRLLRKDGKHMD